MGRQVERRYWITTDTHFGHDMIIEKGDRPENHEQLMLNGFDLIKENDVLIHLGDVAFDNEPEWIDKIREAIKGKWWLVRGNHDKKSDFWYLDRGLDFVGYRTIVRRYGKKILLSHMPQEDLGYFDVNIFGHFHNNDHRFCEDWLIERLTPDKHILMAQEAQNYVPIPLQSILEKRIGTYDIYKVVTDGGLV